MAMKEDGTRVYRGEKVTVAYRRVLNAFGRVCPCGPPCPRPWPRGERKVPFVSLFRPVTILPFFLSSVVLKLLSHRHPLCRFASVTVSTRTIQSLGSKEEGRLDGDRDTGVGGLSGSSPQLPFLLHRVSTGDPPLPLRSAALLTRGVIELS